MFLVSAELNDYIHTLQDVKTSNEILSSTFIVSSYKSGFSFIDKKYNHGI